MTRNDAHKAAQQQIQQALATDIPVLDFVGNNPLATINANAGTYQADLLTADTEVHAGNRVIDVLLQTREDISLDCSYALEVIDTSPPEYGALINHLRSGYSIALLYIQNSDCCVSTADDELIDAIETGLPIENYTPGWINIGEEACLGTILSLENVKYQIKSWANELAPRLNSRYTWTFRETVIPEIPAEHPVTCVGMFEIVDSGCLDCLSSGIYSGFHDHTQQEPIVYLLGTNQEYIKLNQSDLQTIQNTKALARITPLPGSTPSL